MPLVVRFSGTVRLSDSWINEEQVAWLKKQGQLKATIDELLNEDVQAFVDELRGPGGKLTWSCRWED